MKKAELLNQVALRAGLTHRQADDVLAATVDKWVEALSLGQSVRLAGFGSFVVVRQAARRGRNPRTGETMALPSRNKVVFRPSTQLKQALGACV